MTAASIAGGLIVVVALLAACSASPTPPSRDATAGELLATVHVTPTVAGYRLVATSAYAYIGGPTDLSFVRVRILDELELVVRIETERDVSFAEPPHVCLVGPFAAPDDAGLEDRCWGEPELSDLVLAAMSRDGAGRPQLERGSPLTVRTTVRRGTLRCDYPAGTWLLQVKADPLVDGAAAGARYLPDTMFDVPFAQDGPLLLLPPSETRYCGIASVVVKEQGEPDVISPSPLP